MEIFRGESYLPPTGEYLKSDLVLIVMQLTG